MEDSPDVKLGLMVCGSGWYQYVQLITGDKTIFEPFGYFFYGEMIIIHWI